MSKQLSARFASMALALIVPMAGMNAAGAHETPHKRSETQAGFSTEISLADQELLEKIAAAGEHIHRGENHSLKIDLSDADLHAKYGFSQKETEKLHMYLRENPAELRSQNSQNATPEVTTYDQRLIHISNTDLTSGAAVSLATAASAGPEAFEAAFIAYSTMVGGPFGTAVSIAVGALGAAWFADAAAKVVGALAQKKGIGVYSKWGFPPIEVKIEDD